MSSDNASIRVLATMPDSILAQWNNGSVYDGYDTVSQAPRCVLTSDNRRVIIPDIPSRCATRWQLGPELARGNRAIVFRTKDTEGTYVIRIMQIINDAGMARFQRDVEARLTAACLTRDQTKDRTATGMWVGIDHVVDAFYCTRGTTQYGIVVAERYDRTAMDHFVSLETPSDRMWFMARFQWSFDALLRALHSVGIAHRDVHLGNILTGRQTTRSS